MEQAIQTSQPCSQMAHGTQSTAFVRPGACARWCVQFRVDRPLVRHTELQLIMQKKNSWIKEILIKLNDLIWAEPATSYLVPHTWTTALQHIPTSSLNVLNTLHTEDKCKTTHTVMACSWPYLHSSHCKWLENKTAFHKIPRLIYYLGLSKRWQIQSNDNLKVILTLNLSILKENFLCRLTNNRVEQNSPYGDVSFDSQHVSRPLFQ